MTLVPAPGKGQIIDRHDRTIDVLIAVPRPPRRNSQFVQLSTYGGVSDDLRWLCRHPACAAVWLAAATLMDYNNEIDCACARIADHIGVSRQAVSRTLRALEERGLIRHVRTVGSAKVYMLSPNLVTRVNEVATRRLSQFYYGDS